MQTTHQKTYYAVFFISFFCLTAPFIQIHNGQQVSTSYHQATLLILAPDEFYDALVPLVMHKQQIGMNTKLITLSEVYHQMFWHGRDEAEKIKYFIKTAVEEWGTQYILLVGGLKGQTREWYLPVRYVYMDDNWESRYISDLYYADIYDQNGNFSCWDSNGNGIYGEWYYDSPASDTYIDLRPDVAVGRLPCRSLYEVMIMVDKIIMYETYTYGQPWFEDFVVVAGDTYPEQYNPDWVGNEGEYYGDMAIEIMNSFTPHRLYTSDGSFSDQSDVIAAINKGCGFIYFNGHGNPQTWGAHPPNDTVFITGLTTKTMPLLRNGEKLPVCVVGGCHNLQFDVTVLNFFTGLREEGLGFFTYKFFFKEWIPQCWGWRLTRKLGGGSIATLGCTALGYTKEDKDSFTGGLDLVEVAFFEGYHTYNLTKVGDAWAYSVEWYADNYKIDWDSKAVSDSFIDVKIMQSWILFGDPSLQIGGYPPSVFS